MQLWSLDVSSLDAAIKMNGHGKQSLFSVIHAFGMQVIALPTVAAAYAVDSYKPISGEILVICTVVKNTFCFGMSWWVPELTPLQGVMVLFASTSAACLVGVPIYFYGKRLRTITKDNKVHGFEAIM